MRTVLLVAEVRGIDQAGGVNERQGMERAGEVDPVESLGRMIEALAVDLLLRIGGDEGSEHRHQVEGREQVRAQHGDVAAAEMQEE